MQTEELIGKLRTMKELGGHPRFYELLLEIAELHAKKNHDYAQDSDPLSNLRECERFGIPAWKGSLVRITDKISRLTQLASGKQAQITSESLLDTLQDLSVYALLTIILLETQTTK